MVPAPNLKGPKDTMSLSLIDPSQLLAPMTSGKGTQFEIMFHGLMADANDIIRLYVLQLH